MRRVRRWLYGNAAHWTAAYVTVIEHDGEWLVGRIGQTGTETHGGMEEEAAYAYAESIVSGEGWREVPARYDDRHNPVDPGPWVSIGGQWQRPR